jgi:hypothetical protein
LLGWKEDEWRKRAVGVSLVPTEKRPRTKDDDEEDWDMTLYTYGVVNAGNLTIATTRPAGRILFIDHKGFTLGNLA